MEEVVIFCCVLFPAIVMSHHKLKTEDVAQCLISGTSNLTSDVLRQLLAFAPDDREVTMATKDSKATSFAVAVNS